MDEDEIVISGISGRFPESDNIAEFTENLLAGKDLLTEDDRRWEPGFYDLPKRQGNLKTINKFDAQFFGIHGKQSAGMDPQLRILLETAYEAILDAGINPNSMRGSRNGVFIGSSTSESEDALAHDLDTLQGYEVMGCTRSMFANRLSYCFNFHGPSFTIDTGSSSPLLPLLSAVEAIRKGDCEAALVAGANVNLMPHKALRLMRLNMLSKGDNNACRSFDANGDGFALSEGVGTILVQKRSAARRCYATIVHAKSNTDGYKENRIVVPSGHFQTELLKEVYSEAQVDPNDIVYLEAEGNGLLEDDSIETDAITQVLCTKRRTPLLIGSVKSVMGHAESASGMAAVIKVIIAMENGIIPPNLHFTEPSLYIPGLVDGRLQVATEPTPFKGGFVGINSFSYGGSNTHIILKSPVKSTRGKICAPQFPKLILQAGRTKSAVETMMNAAKQHHKNPYFHELLAEEANLSTNSCPYRGYTVITGEEENDTEVHIQKVPSNDSRPVWFIYSGLGTQWTGMGKELMVIKQFKDTIKRCSDCLRPFGYDPYSLIMSEDAETFKNVLHSIICITAIQIALTDLLSLVDLKPDGIIGHSIGEIACAFADGCLTLDQAMLIAYYLGRAIISNGFNKDTVMTTCGLQLQETKKCTSEVCAASHNGLNSISVSADDAEHFGKQLEVGDKFVQTIDSSHSSMMERTKPTLMKTFSDVITKQQLRTEKWISTSIPEENWNDSLAKTCSAEYFVNNFLSPVLFHEALQKIPADAVTIELSPHSLIQENLCDFPETCTKIGLMKYDTKNHLDHFLQSLGQIYQAGVTINTKHLYPPVDGIVPSGTPMIGPLVRWDHSQDYVIVNYKQYGSGSGGVAVGCSFTVDPFADNSQDQYLLDHVIDGKALFPFVGYMLLAWKTLSKSHGLHFEETPIILREVSVFRPTVLVKATKFNVTFLSEAGDFEITDPDDKGLLASGQISLITKETEPNFYDQSDDSLLNDTCDPREYKGADVYKELLLRGYEYGPQFQGIHSISNNCHQGIFEWTGKWVAFIDAFLQATVLSDKSGSLFLPVRIRYLRIDPQKHLKAVQQSDELKYFHYFSDFDTKGAVAGGIELRHIVGQTIPLRGNTAGQMIMEKVSFVKNHDNNCLEEYPEIRDDLQQYKDMCLAVLARGLKMWELNGLNEMPNAQLLKNIIKVLPNNTKLDKLDVYLESQSCALVQYFHHLFNADHSSENKQRFLVDLNNIASDMLPKLEMDKLWSASFLQRSIKPALDTALQNTPGHSMSCAWFEPTDAVNLKTAMELQLTHPLFEPEWLLVGPHVDSLNLQSIQYYSYSTTKLDIENDVNFPENCANLDLVVVDKVLCKKANIIEYIDKIKEMMRDDGMAIIVEITNNFELALAVHAMQGVDLRNSTDKSRIYGMFLKHSQWPKIFENSGFSVVGHQSDPSMISTVYLLHKLPSKPRNPLFINVDDVKEFSWIDPLQKAIEERINEPESETIWLTSAQTRDNGTVGLSLCLREESTIFSRFRFLADISLSKRNGTPAVTLDSETASEMVKGDLHSNHYRDGHFGNFLSMLVPSDQVRIHRLTEHAYIDILSKGDLSTLSWVESQNQYFNILSPKPPDRHLCSVYYSSISFRDVMLASGLLPQDAIPNVPGHFDNRECALGIEFSGRLDDGRRVISIVACQALATSVVTSATLTWEVPEKWSMKEAVSIPGAYTTAYYALICRGNLSSGERVLIHSGSGGVGQAAIRVALSKGCEVFTTVGSVEKKQFLQKQFPKLKDSHFSSSRTTEFEDNVLRETDGKGVHVVLNSLSGEKLQASIRCLSKGGRFLELGKVDLFKDTKLKLSLFNKNISFHGILIDSIWARDVECTELARIMREGIDTGVVQPLPVTLFGRDQVEDAFRYMGSGKHIGRVVLEIRPEENYFCLPPSIQVNAVCRTLCHPQHVYLITGGLGGFGLELTRFLVSRGAKKLVLTSRQGIRNQFQHNRISHCRKLGASVVISSSDISTEEGTQDLMHQCQEMGPIGGVFHLAMVLRDSLFEDQQIQNFKESAIAKYWGTKNLDKFAREMCGSELRWFVAFSSLSSSRGNVGQTCYAWANCSMERVIEQRHADGLPGMAIQWGAVGDVGIVVENMGDNLTVVGGTLPQRIPSCLNTLDIFLSWNHPIVSSFIRADLGRKGGSEQRDFAQTIARIMGLNDPTQLDMDAKLTNLGLDSLMGVEIKQVIEKDYNIVLSMKDIRNLTLGEIKQRIESGELTDNETKEETTQGMADSETDQIAELFKLRMDVNEFLTYDKLVQMNDVSDGPAVFFVHSIEGIATPLRHLANQLPFAAYCFQSTPDVPTETITDMAAHYIKVMKDHQPSGPYNLVGYSFGASVAFEMVGMLQQEDPLSVDHIILLDGSHKYMKTYRDIYRNAFGLTNLSLLDDAGFEVALLSGSVLRVANIDSKKFTADLFQLKDWQARVEMLGDKSMETGLFESRDSFAWACNTVRNKLLAADKYDPKHKFEGTLNLIRAKVSAVREEDCGFDYGIGEVATDSRVYVVDGNHETMVQGDNCQKTADLLTEIICG